MRPNTEEALALYALGVPAAAIARQFGITVGSLKKKASYHKVRRPPPVDRALLARIVRVERIRRNIEDYPSRSICDGIEVAA